MNFRNATIVCFAIALGACTSTQKTTQSQTEVKSVVVEPSVAEAVNAQFCAIAGQCKTLYGEGTITLRDGNSSQSGKFELRSKRSNAVVGDSLSMVISGPFGITAAKFLGSDKEFHFYNAIENDHYHGKPDAATLEKLTGMKGVSLSLLNDLIYGVSPLLLQTEQLSGATIEQLSNGKSRISRLNSLGYVEAVTYKMNGTVPKIISYDRWNRSDIKSALLSSKSDLSVQFSGSIADRPFLMPNLIVATSGSQTLEIEYSAVKENPSNLTVKIKIPQ